MYSVRKFMVGTALVGAAVTGGALGATLIGTANADTPTTTATTAPSGTAATTTPSTDKDGSRGGPHSANGITETPLTGTALAKATAAAQAAVPGATVERAETDAEGAAYEVHMTKADGSQVTVKLNSSFVVTSSVSGRG